MTPTEQLVFQVAAFYLIALVAGFAVGVLLPGNAVAVGMTCFGIGAVCGARDR